MHYGEDLRLLPPSPGAVADEALRPRGSGGAAVVVIVQSSVPAITRRAAPKKNRPAH